VQIGAADAGELVVELGEDVRPVEIYLLRAEGELVRFQQKVAGRGREPALADD
jgi:hypothetical protein